MKNFVAGILATSLLAPQVAAQERIELAPATDWVMNYDADSCALQRQFGAAGQEVFLELRRFGPGDEFQVLVASKDLGARSGDFFVQMLPSDAEPRQIEGLFNLELPDDYHGRMFQHGLAGHDPEYQALYADFVRTTPVLVDEQRTEILEVEELRRRAFERSYDPSDRVWRDLDKAVRADTYQAANRRVKRAFHQSDSYKEFSEQRARSIDGIGLSGAFETSVFLRTGSLGSAFEAMDTCLDELVAHWGVDVEAHRNLTRSVEPYDYNRLVSEMVEDYPREMVRRRIPAYLRVRLDVSAEGTPTGCHLQSGLSDASFEELACNKMMRFAQFYPALDAEGQAIPSYFQVAVVYRPS